jgi:hypothetical protein
MLSLSMKKITFVTILFIGLISFQASAETVPNGKTNQTISASFDVRYNFEKDTGKKWLDATETEQKKYIEKYNKKTTEEMKIESRKKKEKDRKEEQYLREFAQKKRDADLRLKEKQRDQALIKKAKELKKKEQARKIEEAKRKMALMRTRSKNKH